MSVSVDPKDLEDDAGKFERKYILSTGQQKR